MLFAALRHVLRLEISLHPLLIPIITIWLFSIIVIMVDYAFATYLIPKIVGISPIQKITQEIITPSDDPDGQVLDIQHVPAIPPITTITKPKAIKSAPPIATPFRILVRLPYLGTSVGVVFFPSGSFRYFFSYSFSSCCLDFLPILNSLLDFGAGTGSVISIFVPQL